jgi:predicted ABC-type ATPase
MTSSIPRLRMFAGPNGSGKTTVKSALRKPEKWFGVYINPDDLERTIRERGFLPLGPYLVSATTEEVRHYFASSAFLRSKNLHSTTETLVCRDGGIDFSGVAFNSYHASVLADYLRRQALESGRSFTFETVMSARDKVELLKEAQTRGFRTYLYYIATEDPEINIQRVKNRVTDGGHDVPEKKIVERYHRSLNLLAEAIRHTDRAFMFDTSEDEPWYFAEITDGTLLDMKDIEIPNWFIPVWSQFHH